MTISQKKRGQFAFEFIMTYGWAIMVLAVVLAGLSYLFINQTDPFPERCFLGPGFNCYSSMFKHRTLANRDLAILNMQVINNLGKEVSDFFITMEPENSFCGGWIAVGAWAASPANNEWKRPIRNGGIRTLSYHYDVAAASEFRNVFLCDCIEDDCTLLAAIPNCCTSDLAKSYLDGVDTLCPGYISNVNTCIQSLKTGAQKRLRSQLTATYREAGSILFHQRKGFIDLPNVGKY